ncbi:MAG: ribokinase [Clostridia bacterium]|nr:ribokinase [Clostridia bacterium]
MSRIAVIGIAGESVFLSVDGFGLTGETTVASEFHSELGGKGFNQAIAAARYGADVAFLGAAYADDVARFEKIATLRGVKPYFIGKQARSPYAVIETDASGDNRVLVYRGATLSETDVDLFADEIKAADILLLNNEVPVAVNRRAVEIAKRNGVKVILNPAPARENDAEFLEKIDLFTPNEHETLGLENYQNVVVTLGDKGCFIKYLGRAIPAAKPKRVVDTTGAGDTFNGVLAACLADGVGIEAACEKANIAAAIKVSRKYILDSIPFQKEIETYKE